MNEWYTDNYFQFELGLREHQRDSLIPTRNILYFHRMFIYECSMTPPEMDCMGLYCNGWEL